MKNYFALSVAFCGSISTAMAAAESTQVMEDRADKSVRMHISQKETDYNKYSEFIDRSHNYSPEKSFA